MTIILYKIEGTKFDKPSTKYTGIIIASILIGGQALTSITLTLKVTYEHAGIQQQADMHIQGKLNMQSHFREEISTYTTSATKAPLIITS